MPHPLDGARLKTSRAREHLTSFTREVQAYVDARPYELPCDICSGNVTLSAARIVDHPPLGLSCVLGDSLVNLRASLDYVAWELATRYAPTPPEFGNKKDRRIRFPISVKRPPTDTLHILAVDYGIPGAAIDCIERVQPYHNGYESLDVLNRLVNRDKHCLLLLTKAQARTYMLALGVGNSTPAEASNCTSLSISAHRQVRPEEVNFSGDVDVFVSLQDPVISTESIVHMLERMVACVEKVIPQFDAFF